jgi:spore coat protein U-like protein
MPRASLIRSLAAAAAALLLAPAPAHACTVTTIGVAFGTYSSSHGTPTDGVGGISLACHPAARPVIAIDAGSSGAYSERQMRSGTHQLGYNLFTDASRTVVWGNGSGGTATVSPTGTVSAGVRQFSAPVYGRIPARQNAAAGSYGDTLMVTITF